MNLTIQMLSEAIAAENAKAQAALDSINDLIRQCERELASITVREIQARAKLRADHEKAVAKLQFDHEKRMEALELAHKQALDKVNQEA